MKRSTYAGSILVLAASFLAASFVPAAVAHENQGFIYGKIKMRSGNEYKGVIRWNDEEAFWDDLFHSYKERRPYEDYLEEHGHIGKVEIDDLEDEIRDIEREQEELEREIDRLSERIEQLARREAKAKDADRREQIADERSEVIEELTERAREIAELATERAEFEKEKEHIWTIGPKKTISILGGKLNLNWNDWSGGTRIFIARFGDIKTLEVIGSEDAELTMRTGSKYTVSGYSNDVGATIRIRDGSLGDIKIPWKKIGMIEFMETPRNVNPPGYRLHGTVYADGGEYAGFIQWDSQECLSIDKLDGDSEDGEMSIPMGNIRVIERRSRGSAWVELKDGRRFQLEGSNDVDQSIRGIMVEAERYGRAKIPWDAFDKVVFDDNVGSGRGYDDYKPEKLRGTVHDTDGGRHSGTIVFDLDESESWEMLNGDLFDIEFDIPFGNVKTITPRSRNACEIELRSGESIRLEGGQDVTEANDGVLVFTNGEDNEPTYISWDRIDRIELN
ncbi:MAG: hypothetical protein MAG453_01469 [Calditrichaeota bacterium]|nr:hypothetical protein [Calditrichota bacterium]